MEPLFSIEFYCQACKKDFLATDLVDEPKVDTKLTCPECSGIDIHFRLFPDTKRKPCEHLDVEVRDGIRISYKYCKDCGEYLGSE